MNIAGLGPKIVKQLIAKGLVHNVADLYYLTADDLSQLDHFKEKSINNLLAAIDQSRKNSVELVLFGLGIDNVGGKAAQLIAQKFKNMSKIASASVQELTAIDTIGMTIAESLTAYFQQEEAKKLLARLEEAAPEQRPLLHLDMRLGEGTGGAVAYGLLRCAADIYNNMATFSAAGVAEQTC